MKKNFWNNLWENIWVRKIPQKTNEEKLLEEVVLIRKRIGWIIFWLIILAIGIGKLIPY